MRKNIREIGEWFQGITATFRPLFFQQIPIAKNPNHQVMMVSNIHLFLNIFSFPSVLFSSTLIPSSFPLSTLLMFLFWFKKEDSFWYNGKQGNRDIHSIFRCKQCQRKDVQRQSVEFRQKHGFDSKSFVKTIKLCSFFYNAEREQRYIYEEDNLINSEIERECIT